MNAVYLLERRTIVWKSGIKQKLKTVSKTQNKKAVEGWCKWEGKMIADTRKRKNDE